MKNRKITIKKEKDKVSIDDYDKETDTTKSLEMDPEEYIELVRLILEEMRNFTYNIKSIFG